MQKEISEAKPKTLGSVLFSFSKLFFWGEGGVQFPDYFTTRNYYHIRGKIKKKKKTNVDFT